MGYSSPLTRPVHFRIAEEKYRRYEAEAVAADMHLSAFLRMRLEVADGLAEELARLRLAVLAQADDQSYTAASRTLPDPTNVEALLLLRALVSPTQLRAARAEMDRCGLTPWSPADVKTHGTGL